MAKIEQLNKLRERHLSVAIGIALENFVEEDASPAGRSDRYWLRQFQNRKLNEQEIVAFLAQYKLNRGPRWRHTDLKHIINDDVPLDISKAVSQFSSAKGETRHGAVSKQISATSKFLFYKFPEEKLYIFDSLGGVDKRLQPEA